jgi:hypothetical protein
MNLAFFLLMIPSLMMNGLWSIPYQDGIVVENARASYQFGEFITYEASFRSPASIREIYLFIYPEGEETFSVKVIPNSQGDVIFRQDVKKVPLRPFSKITYWYQILLSNNSNYKSDSFSFDYKDNRFSWQTLENNEFQIHWYERDLTFGQLALSTALRGLSNAQSYLNLSPSNTIRIYIYNNSSDFLSAYSNGNRSWIAGHTSPDINAILITIPVGPEQKMELERQIPHEIMHILQYQLTGPAFRQVPVWLIEGLASIAELYPNSEYQRVLLDAVETKKLHSTAMLCNSFPSDASGAFLAYAQSASFVQFLYQNYGASGIRRLIEEYLNGLGCEEGVLSAYGTSLTQLDLRWQQKTFKSNPLFDVVNQLLPFFLIAVLLIFPLIIVAGNANHSRKSRPLNATKKS